MISAIILEEKIIDRTQEDIDNLKNLVLNLTGKGFRNIYLFIEESQDISKLDLKKLNIQISLYKKDLFTQEYFSDFWSSLPDQRLFFLNTNSYPENLHEIREFLKSKADYVFAVEDSKIYDTFVIDRSLLLSLEGNPFGALRQIYDKEDQPKDKIFDFKNSSESDFYSHVRCHNKITFSKEEKFFGPGVKMLLEYIEQMGSVKSAAERMELSYSKAWKMINRMEKELGAEVIERIPGGVTGGESFLTDFGKEFLIKYELLSMECDKFMVKTYNEIFR